MTRYFFNVRQDISEPDIEGFECADIHAARAAAMRLCGEMIKEFDGKFWAAPLWQLDVSSREGGILFTLTFSAAERLAGG